LLTNPAVTQGAVSAAAALAAVEEATRHAGHEFWPLDRGMTIGLQALAARLQGHRQWTDAVLLWQATQRGGVLVTFDSGVKTLAPREAASRVLILKRS
jgi:predicted nucleic acid-binding protein